MWSWATLIQSGGPRFGGPYSILVLPVAVFMAYTGTGLLLLFTFAIINSLQRT